MLTFIFPPNVQALIASGAYEVVRSKATGQLLGLVRDKATGRFVQYGIAVMTKGTPLAPLIAAAQFVEIAGIGGLVIQNHLGFQEVSKKVDIAIKGLRILESNLGVLQATTALIGVGTVAGVVLSAVNLHQTLKLREDVKQLRLEVKEGFIDLKTALKDQREEIIQHIEQVAADVEFRQHRTILAQSYGRFLEATKLIKVAMTCEDISVRNADLANARQILFVALGDYNNPHFLSDTCAAGKLRRLECTWAIEQTIILSYQLQNELAAVSDRLSHLQAKMRQDALSVVEACNTKDELDFLFPELTRIHDQDLAVLESWQNHVDWVRSLPPSELKLLESADFSDPKVAANSEITADVIPPEQIFYQELQEKSHPLSLKDQLRFMMKPELRQEPESYISDRATKAGHKALVSENLQKASHLTVSNLYWYFKSREESEIEEKAIAVFQ